MGYMIDAFIFPTLIKLAAEVPVKPVLAVKLLSWRCLAIQLDEVGSATVSLLLLVCRVSSCRIKDRKGMLHVWKFETHILVHVICFQSLLSIIYLLYK